MNAIEIRDLLFSYKDNKPILKIPSLTIAKGDCVFLHGPSGSGKSTLLGQLSGVLDPSARQFDILGQSYLGMSGASRDRFRAVSIGYIFQVFNLVPFLNVEENIRLPEVFGRSKSAQYPNAEDELMDLSSKLGISALLKKPVLQLSIGQQQRVAAARALFGSPGLILADEPTSALDEDARISFLDLIFAQVAREKSTLVFVSHDKSLASRFSKTLSLPEINEVKSSHLVHGRTV
jgi:putative ABC transport system ATP-binding protein